LAIVAIPAVAYSTGTGQRHGQHPAKSSGAKTEKQKKAKTCEKGRVRKHGKCAKRRPSPPSTTPSPPTTTTTPTTATTPTTTAAPEALSATLIVHVYGEGGLPVAGGPKGLTCEEVLRGLPSREGVENECRGGDLWTKVDDESMLLSITRLNPGGAVPLGPDGEILRNALVTKEHTVHVAPGRYEVALAVDTKYTPETVTVREGQTVEVELIITLM
jgi:hypothetical protein